MSYIKLLPIMIFSMFINEQIYCMFKKKPKFEEIALADLIPAVIADAKNGELGSAIRLLICSKIDCVQIIIALLHEPEQNVINEIFSNSSYLALMLTKTQGRRLATMYHAHKGNCDIAHDQLCHRKVFKKHTVVACAFQGMAARKDGSTAILFFTERPWLIDKLTQGDLDQAYNQTPSPTTKKHIGTLVSMKS